MEFTERKRSRKSQSFKLVNQDYNDLFKASGYSSDVNGESKDSEQFSGDESLEIKKQITGMRRLLNDSTGRIYQRVGKEGEKLKQEPHELDLSSSPSLSTPWEAEEPNHSSQSPWNDLPSQTTPFSGQYGTRSKTVQNQVKNTAAESNGELRMVNSSAESKCCTCNCQPTLQAILQELKAMRKFMQAGASCSRDTYRGKVSPVAPLQEKQNGGLNPPSPASCRPIGNNSVIRCSFQLAAAQSRQQIPQSCVCAQKPVVSRKRIKKKKVPPKIVAAAAVPVNRRGSGSEHKSTVVPERPSISEKEPAIKEESHVLGFGIVHKSSSADPEVQLAEGFDIFMPKSQLDSILSNYTRSGSLLFRKLVCAFFDDKTLANSLPNGKRKRGLNDNRKGLDQNIVGAIKVFTEKYCTANNVDKVPGPRDWVQILQDQIKLARRRLKRGCDSEFPDYDDKTDVISVPHTGSLFQTTDDDMWLNPKTGF
ncbi:BEN domain-containing protein 7 isoform X2 [Ascaphus truei]|uniref:BEN domain-containing protein 7 isoform X2 n=1 Tax=Ascaphus truei TaxID=8439 RepID=UPI003F5A0ECB